MTPRSLLVEIETVNPETGTLVGITLETLRALTTAISKRSLEAGEKLSHTDKE
jgi:hypothetical protein